MKKMVSVLSLGLCIFSAQVHASDCGKAEAESSIKTLDQVDNFKGDLKLFKVNALSTIQSYIKTLEAKTTEDKTEAQKLLIEADQLCKIQAD